MYSSCVFEGECSQDVQLLCLWRGTLTGCAALLFVRGVLTGCTALVSLKGSAHRMCSSCVFEGECSQDVQLLCL